MKAKAKEDEAFQKKASISVPLVDEHSDDIRAAKRVEFGSSGFSHERRKRRLEIVTQSVFDKPSDKKGDGVSSGASKARALLLAARSKTRGGAFSAPSSSLRNRTGVTRTGVVRTECLRDSLGIKTVNKNTST
jgi:hypothetical protein